MESSRKTSLPHKTPKQQYQQQLSSAGNTTHRQRNSKHPNDTTTCPAKNLPPVKNASSLLKNTSSSLSTNGADGSVGFGVNLNASNSIPAPVRASGPPPARTQALVSITPSSSFDVSAKTRLYRSSATTDCTKKKFADGITEVRTSAFSSTSSPSTDWSGRKGVSGINKNNSGANDNANINTAHDRGNPWKRGTPSVVATSSIVAAGCKDNATVGSESVDHSRRNCWKIDEREPKGFKGSVGLKKREDEGGTQGQQGTPTPAEAEAQSQAGTSNQLDSAAALDDNSHAYVGLQNQANTCYLNSLIQTLFMTPEFRNAIFKMMFNGTKDEEMRSIACQLKKIFALLQTTGEKSLQTTDITNSFGWKNNEALEQHDIQELCRLMFDALEQKWRNTPNAELVQNLYRGTMLDYVQCLNCKRQNVKFVPFLDLPLATKHCATGTPFESIEEALHAFVKPELLDGANQYFCDNCQSKQNALKGLRFKEFPYLLSIQLKRFDFNLFLSQRVKLNNKITFPMLLNLNEFMHSTTIQSEPAKKMSWANAVKSTKRAESSSDAAASPTKIDYVQRAEEQSMRIDEDEVNELLKKDGPYVYELFSVLVHQGTISNGHYFAYVKNMDQKEWFCFNDSHVTRATLEQIHQTWGGMKGGWSSSHTNAYMLMYRKVDRQRNEKFMKTVDMPNDLKMQLKRWHQEEVEKLEEWRYEATLVNVSVMYNSSDGSGSVGGWWHRRVGCASGAKYHLRVSYTVKLYEIYIRAIRRFIERRCDDHSIEEDFRLLKCNSCLFNIVDEFSKEQLLEMSIADAFPSCTKETAANCAISTRGQHRSGSKSNTRRSADVYLVLDCKPRAMKKFYGITKTSDDRLSGAFTLNVVPLDVQNGTYGRARLVQFADSETVAQMKTKIAALYEESEESAAALRLVLDKGIVSPPTMFLFNIDGLQARDVVGDRSTIAMKLFVDCAYDYGSQGSRGAIRNADRCKSFSESLMCEMLERQKRTIKLKIILPECDDYKHITMNGPPPESIVARSRSVTPIPSTQSTGGFIQNEQENNGAENGSNDGSSKKLYSNNSNDVGDCKTKMKKDTNISDDDTDYRRGVGSQFNINVYKDEGDEDDFDLDDSDVDGYLDRDEEQITLSLPKNIAFSALNTTPDGELTILADDRQTVYNLRSWIADQLVIDVNQFAILKHYRQGESGYESAIWNCNETLHEAYSSVLYLSVKLREPLKKDQRLVPVVNYALNAEEPDEWLFLFDVTGTVDMSIGEVLKMCDEKLGMVYGRNHGTGRLRLREMINGVGLPILSSGDRLGRRGKNWNETLYLQVLEVDEALAYERVGIGAYPVTVCRWNPTELSVGERVEVIVSAAAQDQIRALKGAISRQFHVKLEDIELSTAYPTVGSAAKWPYTVQRCALIDEVHFSKGGLIPASGTFNGKLVYFRLSSDRIKLVTEEMKNDIRRQDGKKKGKINDEREHPLRIQYSMSVSEE